MPGIPKAERIAEKRIPFFLEFGLDMATEKEDDWAQRPKGPKAQRPSFSFMSGALFQSDEPDFRGPTARFSDLHIRIRGGWSWVLSVPREIFAFG